MERPLLRFECGLGVLETRRVTILGIQPDRIERGRLYTERVGLPGETSVRPGESGRDRYMQPVGTSYCSGTFTWQALIRSISGLRD